MSILTKDQKKFFREREKDMPAYMLALKKVLLRIGGEAVVLWTFGGPACSEEEATLLIAGGTVFSREDLQTVRGEPSNCEENALKLSEKKGFLFAGGFGLSEDGIWRRHVWCVDHKGRIIETTKTRTVYFGCAVRPRRTSEEQPLPNLSGVGTLRDTRHRAPKTSQELI